MVWKEEGETYYQVPLYTRDLCGDRNKRRKTEKKTLKSQGLNSELVPLDARHRPNSSVAPSDLPVAMHHVMKAWVLFSIKFRPL